MSGGAYAADRYDPIWDSSLGVDMLLAMACLWQGLTEAEWLALHEPDTGPTWPSWWGVPGSWGAITSMSASYDPDFHAVFVDES